MGPMTTESDPAFVPKPAPPGYRYAGPWIRLTAWLIDGVLVVLALMALWLVLGLALAVSGYLLNPLRSSEIEGWPGGAVVYVVESVVMLGWYGGWQAGVVDGLGYSTRELIRNAGAGDLNVHW